jgi:hypothetical protein
VALIVSKFAIVVTLTVAVKMLAHPVSAASGDPLSDSTAAVGTLVTGFTCFLIAAVSPWVLYRLIPVVEAAGAGHGLAGSWTRGAMTAIGTAMTVKSLGAGAALSPSTRAVPGQASAASLGPTSDGSGAADGGTRRTGAVRSPASTDVATSNPAASTTPDPVPPAPASGRDRRRDGS